MTTGMPPRQIWMLRLGCWIACGFAVLHLAIHLATAGPLAAATSPAGAAPPFVFRIPGLLQPEFAGVFTGFSLSVSLLAATIGAGGLAVIRYGGDNEPLLRGVARAFAIGTAGLLVVSIASFFSLQTFVISLMAMCFGLACVPQE
jgi:hypothetical protein